MNDDPDEVILVDLDDGETGYAGLTRSDTGGVGLHRAISASVSSISEGRDAFAATARGEEDHRACLRTQLWPHRPPTRRRAETRAAERRLAGGTGSRSSAALGAASPTIGAPVCSDLIRRMKSGIHFTIPTPGSKCGRTRGGVPGFRVDGPSGAQ